MGEEGRAQKEDEDGEVQTREIGEEGGVEREGGKYINLIS